MAFIVIPAVLIGFGCQHQYEKPPEKEPFFEKWRTAADQSKGYSPAPKTRSIQLDEPSGTAAQPAGPVADELLSRQLITLKMHNVDVAVLLRAMAKAAGQSIVINESVSGKVNIDVDKKPWGEVFLSILSARGLDYERDGDILRIVTLEDRSRNLQQLETEEKIKKKRQEIALVEPLITRVISIDYADAAKLKTNLEMFLTEKQEKPVGSVMVDEHTNSLIIQALREDLSEMIPIIEALDRPTKQVLIEAHIVEATKLTARELGVAWGGLYSNTGAGYSIVGDATQATGVAQGNPIVPTTEYMVNSADTPINVVGDISRAGVAGGLNIGLIAENIGSGILIAQLQALEEEGELNILSSPSITTLDNQTATIESGEKVPVKTTQDLENKVEYQDASLLLEVKPHIIDDKTISLKIKTLKDEVDDTRDVDGNPYIVTKRAETNVILFDGQTTVIGGLTKDSEGDAESGERGQTAILKWPNR